MSVDEGARRVVEVMAGKWLISSSIALFLAGVGFLHSDSSALHAAVNSHSEKLSHIDQKLDDLITAYNDQAGATRAAIDKLTDNDQSHSIAIARAEEKIEEIQRERALPPRIERESLVIPSPSPPTIIAPVIKALSHVFSPPRRVFTRHRARN